MKARLSYYLLRLGARLGAEGASSAAAAGSEPCNMATLAPCRALRSGGSDAVFAAGQGLAWIAESECPFAACPMGRPGVLAHLGAVRPRNGESAAPSCAAKPARCSIRAGTSSTARIFLASSCSRARSGSMRKRSAIVKVRSWARALSSATVSICAASPSSGTRRASWMDTAPFIAPSSPILQEVRSWPEGENKPWSRPCRSSQ